MKTSHKFLIGGVALLAWGIVVLAVVGTIGVMGYRHFYPAEVSGHYVAAQGAMILRASEDGKGKAKYFPVCNHCGTVHCTPHALTASTKIPFTDSFQCSKCKKTQEVIINRVD